MADTPTATPATPDEGFLHSLATSLGIDPEAVKAAAKSFYAHPLETAEEVGGQQVTELAEAAKHPIDTAKNVAEGVASAITNPEAQATAKTRFKKPGVINKLVGAEEYATGAVPLVGGGLAKAEEQGVQGNLPGEAGTMVGTLAPVFAGEAEDIPAKIHEAGAEARTNIEARRAANIAEAKTGKIIDVKPGVPTGLPAAPENLESEFSKLGGKKIAEPEPVPDLVTNETQPPAEIKTEGPAWDRTHSAFVDGEKVGSVGYKLDPTGRAQIYGSQVNPELRGQGIGQQMYRSVIDEAREAGANRVTSDSTNTTPDANRVWDKLQEKGLPVENITHPNGKPGYQIDFSKTPQVAPDQKVFFSKDVLGDTGKYVGGLTEQKDDVVKQLEQSRIHPQVRPVPYASDQPFTNKTAPAMILDDGRIIPALLAHRDIANIAGFRSATPVEDFQKVTGAVRVIYPNNKMGTIGLELHHPPTDIQLSLAAHAIKSAEAAGIGNGSVVWDLAKPDGGYQSGHGSIGDFQRAVESHYSETPDLQTTERQSELKEPYSVKIKESDGTERVESIEAFSPKNAIATAQKQFPTANEWGIESFGERTPSTAYTVPTQKPLSIHPLASYSFPHTMTHELGHALIGQNEGLVQKGMLRHTHPDVGNRAVASVGWKAADLYQGGRRDLVKSEKLPAVVRTFMGGIAADEAFNDMPRGANVNLGTERPGSDGNVAYRFLRAAGYDHDQAMDYMHQSIDYAKEYLTKPAISDLIKENVGVREKGLSTQYHFSSERLANMHAEAQRRLANGPEESGNDRTTGEGRNPNRPADVAAGESGTAPTPGPADKEEGLTTAAMQKVDPARQIVDLHKANGGSTFNLTHGNLAGTDTYAVSTNPERGQILKAPPTAKDIQKFIAKNQDLLKNPDKSVGTWADTSNGTHVLDVVSTPSDREEAIALGKQHNQKAIFDLKKGEEINTGGTGKVPNARTSQEAINAIKKYASQGDYQVSPPGKTEPRLAYGFMLADGSLVDSDAARETPHYQLADQVGFDSLQEANAIRVAGSDNVEVLNGAPTEEQRAEISRLVREGGKDKLTWDFHNLRDWGAFEDFTRGEDPEGNYVAPLESGEGSLGDFFRAADAFYQKTNPPDLLSKDMGTTSPTVSTRVPTKTVKGEEINTGGTGEPPKALPPQPKLPEKGQFAAIQTDDGAIYPDLHPEKQRTHIMLADDLGIPPERITGGGWLKDGVYEDAGYRSDAGRYGEQARAKISAESHRADAAQSSTVSTRVPTKIVKGETVEDHTNQSRMSDMEAAKTAPGYVPKMVDRIKDVPGFKAPEGGDAQANADAYIRHVADNVKFVYSKLSPEEIARDEQWYPVGAHNRVQAVAKQHGFTPTQIAGVTAVESPMTDWDQNTSLAERTADIWKNQQNTKFTPEMQEAADKITSIPANAKFKSVYKSLRGKTLGQLPTVEEQAHWLRLYDEAHNPRDYQTWNPDGTSAGLAQNDDGTPGKVGWSFQNHIEKAIRILKDGSPESISKELGYGHKVRNFYNNMIAPDDPRFLTVDTHAVNIAQLRPMAGKNLDVALNFEKIKNGAYGLKGIYPMHDAGYRLAAKELDIPIPSRLQSPTWVKIREVFNDNFKTPENLQVIDAIWKEHTDGHITADQARNRVWDYATRWNDQAAAEAQHPGNAGELPQASLFGEPTGGAAGRGIGSGTPGAVPEKGISKSERIFSIAKPKAKGKGTSALDLLNALGGLKKPAK